MKKVARTLPCREIRAGDLALDPDADILHRDETAKRLRPKEAEMLALFMRNRGKILSRREIMKKVWQTDYLEATRTLNVHIRWLRTQIEDEPADPCYLRTVRGAGYRFDPPEPMEDLTPGDTIVQ